MNKIRIRSPKTLLAVLFSVALLTVTAAAALVPQGGDRGFTISGKKLIIKKDFVHELRDNTVTVRRRTAATTTGTTTCKCSDGAKKGCTVTDAPDTDDGGKVQLCGGKSCCDWR